MPLAADYPFLDILWTMILFFAWVAWIGVLVVIIADLFRRHDASGWVKALWVVFLIVFPFIGVLGYLIVNGKEMSERSAKHAFASRPAPVQAGAATEIEKAKALLDSGAVNQAEYEKLKSMVLT